MSFWTILAMSLVSGQPAAPSQNSAQDVPVQSAALPPEHTYEDASPDELIEGQTDYYSRMTVPVTIEGEGPFRFMIDTGAQATVVTRGLTEKLNLMPNGSAIVVGMGSRVPAQLFELTSLEFAERVFYNVSAPMLESRHVGADGILGLDSLQDLRVMIDFREDTIAVNDSKELGGNSGYEIVVRARHKLGRLIITQARIDGVRTAVVIDTGAQSSFGNRALQKRLRMRSSEQVSSTDVNGAKITGDLHIARTLQIQDLALNNMPITFADSPAFAALGLDDQPALVLGMRDLRLFDRVAIDFATRQVLFDLPAGAGRNDLMRRKFFPTRL